MEINNGGTTVKTNNISALIYPPSFKYPIQPTAAATQQPTAKYPTTTITTTMTATTTSDLNYQPYSSAHVRRQSLQMQLSQRGSPVKEFASPTNHTAPPIQPTNHFCHVPAQPTRSIHYPNHHDSCGQISTTTLAEQQGTNTVEHQVQHSPRTCTSDVKDSNQHPAPVHHHHHHQLHQQHSFQNTASYEAAYQAPAFAVCSDDSMVRITSSEAKRHSSLPTNPCPQQQSLVQQLQQRRFQRRLKVAATTHQQAPAHQLPSPNSAYQLPFNQFQHLRIDSATSGANDSAAVRWMAPAALAVSQKYENGGGGSGDLLWMAANQELLTAAASGNADLLAAAATAANTKTNLLLDTQQHMEYSMT